MGRIKEENQKALSLIKKIAPKSQMSDYSIQKRRFSREERQISCREFTLFYRLF
jgi:hypothetical protein